METGDGKGFVGVARKAAKCWPPRGARVVFNALILRKKNERRDGPMGEDSIKRQLNNAIDSLSNKYPPPIYRSIKLRDSSCPFHLEVFRNSEAKGEEVFKFRVTLNKITLEDEALCRKYILPGKIFTKMIACKMGRNKWIYKEIL